MDDPSRDAAAELRFLESWLPLAQAESDRFGWGYDGPQLERLILLAAPGLHQMPSLLAARALFWHYHQRMERGEV